MSMKFDVLRLGLLFIFLGFVVIGQATNLNNPPNKNQTMSKVLIIGLDGAELDLILPWIEEGKLPNLATLINSGTYGNLTTSLPIESPVAWTSMFTGCNPGKHGIYGFMKELPDSYERVPATALDIKAKTLWEIAGEHGKRSVVINVPMTYPPKKLNGILISGYLSQRSGTFTYPASLSEELRKRDYRIVAMQKPFAFGLEEDFLESLNYTVEKRAEVALDLMGKEDWDLFFVAFTGLDRLQHYFWKYMEEDHPKYGDSILNHYQKLDQIVGKLVEKAGENTTIIVVSDHGFGPLKGEIYTNYWLRKKGYLTLKSSSFWKSIGLSTYTVRNILVRLRLYNLIKRLMIRFGVWDGSQRLLEFNSSDVLWNQTKAFGGLYGGPIFFNKEYYPEGIVTEVEYQGLKNEIIEGLKEIRDPKTGEQVVKKVYERDEIYKGNHTKFAPDLVIETWKYNFIGGLGHVNLFNPYVEKSGAHRLEGILIISGKNIKKGQINASIYDVAPTALYLLGVPIPQSMDGKILKNALTNR